MTLHDDLKNLWDVLPEGIRLMMRRNTDGTYATWDGGGTCQLSLESASALLCHAAMEWLIAEGYYVGTEYNRPYGDTPKWYAHFEKIASPTRHETVMADSLPAALAAAVKAVKEWRAE